MTNSKSHLILQLVNKRLAQSLYDPLITLAQVQVRLPSGTACGLPEASFFMSPIAACQNAWHFKNAAKLTF